MITCIYTLQYTILKYVTIIAVLTFVILGQTFEERNGDST